MDPTGTFTMIGAAIAAMAALGVAAFGLIDASKALWGGIANIGFKHIERGCAPFANVLRRATGQESWPSILRAQWRNGRDKESQKAVVRSLVRLGLTEGAVEELSGLANVRSKRLAEVTEKLSRGDELNEADASVLGRIDAVIGIRIDAAFERADQQYRNVTRLAAGFVAVVLALGVGYVLEENLWLALAAGLLAVPIAPIAKDLTSSLSAAVNAVKAMRRGR